MDLLKENEQADERHELNPLSLYAEEKVRLKNF